MVAVIHAALDLLEAQALIECQVLDHDLIGVQTRLAQPTLTRLLFRERHQLPAKSLPLKRGINRHILDEQRLLLRLYHQQASDLRA